MASGGDRWSESGGSNGRAKAGVTAGLAVAWLALTIALPGPVAAAGSGGWGEAHLLQAPELADAASTDVAVGPGGVAFVAWLQSGSNHEVWAASFDPGSGWSKSTQLSVSSQTAASPSIAAGSDGTAMAVWAQNDGGNINPWASYYTPSTGWQNAQKLALSDQTDASAPQVAAGPNGYYVAVWQASGGSYDRIWANIFAPSVSWGGDLAIDADLGYAQAPAAGFDAAGDILVVWDANDGAHESIGWSRFVPDQAWSTAAWAETDDVTDAEYVSLAVRSDGSALAAWTRYNVTAGYAVAAPFSPGTGWGPVVKVSSNIVYDATDAQAATDDSGVGYLVYGQASAVGERTMVARYVPASGWGAPAMVSGDYGTALDGRIAMAPSGGAVAVFDQQSGAPRHVWLNRYVVGSGWTGASMLDGFEAGLAVWPAVAVAADGEVAVAWSQYNGTVLRAWANVYMPADTAAPALTVSSPTAGANLTAPEVRVAGTTEARAVVVVDGQTAAVAADGSFALTVPVVAGPTTIRVTATDMAGNVATSVVNVTYWDPTPALAAELAQARADAAAASASANATAAQLAATQAALATTQANLSAAQSSLSTTQSALASAQGELSQTRTQLNATQGASAPPPPPDPVAMIVALLGVALGAGAFGVAMLSRRAGAPKAAAPAPGGPDAPPGGKPPT